MVQNPPTGADAGDPDPREIRDRADLAAALLSLKASANLSYRRLERVTADAPGARFGLPFTTIRDYVQGRSLPTPDRLDQIVWACGVADPDRRAEWVRALRRVVDAGDQSRAADPYRGLAPYGEDDAERFHGRAALVAELLERLPAAGSGGSRLLAVVGASGAGTTSLLRAGLVSALRRDQPARPVRCGSPGADPAGQLAELLGADRPRPGAPAPVVVLDDLEQLFAAAAPARTAFLTMLEEAVTGPGSTVVVVGLRADRVARARREPVLAAALDGREVVVRPMSADELRLAIVGPATGAGRAVGDGLVELLLHELRPPRGAAGAADGAVGCAHGPGALALLSLALSATWASAEGGELTVADYRAGGGLDGAATQVAEAALAGLGAEQLQVARAVLLRLVRFADDAEPTRRRAAAAELAELPDAAPVVERLVVGRVLTATGDTIEITHDVLLHSWPRLAAWLAEDRAGHAVRGALAEAARRWQDSDTDPDLLLRGSPLSEAVDWAAGLAGDELAPTELRYLRESLDRDSRDHAVQHGRVRRLRLAVAVLALVATVLVGLAAVVLLTGPEPITQCPAPSPAAQSAGGSADGMTSGAAEP
jgi:conflict system STAND superfamily ATPase